MAFEFKVNSFKGLKLDKMYTSVNNSNISSDSPINYSYEEIDYSSMPVEQVESNSIKLSDENLICLNKFSSLFDDGYSNEEVVKHCYDAFEKEILNGNKDVEKLLKAMIKLKIENPDLTISLSTEGSYYSTAKDISISSEILEMNNTSTIFHEMGHAFHHLIANNEINIDVKGMITKAKNTKESNFYMSELYDWFVLKQIEINDTTYIEFYEEVKKATGMNQEEYYNSIVKKYDLIRDNKIMDELRNYVYGESDDDNILQQLDIDIEIAQMLVDTDISEEDMASQYIWEEINSRIEAKEREMGLAAMHDIIDAVYQGEYFDMTQVSSNGTILKVYGHGSNYYSDFYYVYAELIANYTDLKTSRNEQAILDLKKVFGESFLNEIDEIYNSFLEYGNYTQI